MSNNELINQYVIELVNAMMDIYKNKVTELIDRDKELMWVEPSQILICVLDELIQDITLTIANNYSFNEIECRKKQLELVTILMNNRIDSLSSELKLAMEKNNEQ